MERNLVALSGPPQPESCPSCRAQCWDGGGCSCSSPLRALDAVRFQPGPVLGAAPSGMGALKVSAAHQHRGNSLGAWDSLGHSGFQQQVMKQLVPS